MLPLHELGCLSDILWLLSARLAMEGLFHLLGAFHHGLLLAEVVHRLPNFRIVLLMLRGLIVIKM